MKNLSALICSFFSVLIFSAAVHAAPVQYQLTAYHSSEATQMSPGEYAPVSANDYFFADGTPFTVTFYYDSAAAATATATDFPMTTIGELGPYPARASFYNAFSNFTFNLAGQTIYQSQWRGLIINSDSSNPYSHADAVMAIPSMLGGLGSDFDQLSPSAYKASSATIVIGGGYANMLSSLSLPDTLIGLNAAYSGITLNFSSANDTRSVRFSEGVISQVSLPSAALFFLSGLIGLGANSFRKANK